MHKNRCIKNAGTSRTRSRKSSRREFDLKFEPETNHPRPPSPNLSRRRKSPWQGMLNEFFEPNILHAFNPPSSAIHTSLCIRIYVYVYKLITIYARLSSIYRLDAACVVVSYNPQHPLRGRDNRRKNRSRVVATD